MVSWQVSCKWPSTLNTTTEGVPDWSKSQGIASVAVVSAEDSGVESFETVHRDIAKPVVKETAAKKEQPLDTMHNVVLADNQLECMLTAAPEQKSGDTEVSKNVKEELLPEPPTVEPPLVSAVDEYRATLKTDDLPTTAAAMNFKLEEPMDVTGTKSLRTDIQLLQAEHAPHVLDSVTERIKTLEVIKERALQLDNPLFTVMGRKIPTEPSKENSEEKIFPTADWSLSSLHFDNSTSKTDVLSTKALAVQSDMEPEVDESVGPAKSVGEIGMEMDGREKIQSGVFDELHDAETSVEGKPKESIKVERSMIYAYSLEQIPDAFEDAHKKKAFTSDTCEIMNEDGKTPQKIVAALILDVNTVRIHTSEVLGSANDAEEIYSASVTGYDTMFSQQVERLETTNKTAEEFDHNASLDQQELEKAKNVVDSTQLNQSPEENIEGSLQTLVQIKETQILTRISEPNTTEIEIEGTLTTNNGPQEVQRAMEPLEHWTVNNGPRETQRRYIVLERQEGLEIQQEPAAEAHVPALDAATSKPGGVVTDVSKIESTENVEQESGEANLLLPTSQHQKHDETQLTPERRQKEKKVHQQLELEKTSIKAVEEPLVKPTPPVRRKISQIESDSILVISETQKVDETLVKPTPLTRKRDSRNMTEPVSGISDLDITRTKEATLPGRQKASLDESPLISKPQRTDDILVRSTPLTRRQDSRSVIDTVSEETARQISRSAELEKTVTQERAVKDLFVKPTPPVRRKGSQASQIQEMEETLVTPTPPARRRNSRNFSDGVYREMTSKISRSTDLEKTVTQEKVLEEPLIKPTPPVRRKVSSLSSQIESDVVSVLSKIQEAGENVVKPTPPARRRDSRNVGDINISSSFDLQETVTQEQSLAESLLKPTPPMRRKASQVKDNEIEAALLKPTPPVRRRNSGNMTDTAVRRTSGSCDLEKLTWTPERTVEETSVKPTPPGRRKTSRAESDISILDKTKETEETSVRPTPLVKRIDSRSASDIITIKGSSSVDVEEIVEDLVSKATPPMGQKTSPAETGHSTVPKTLETDDTLVKPTPPTRRENKNVSDAVVGTVSSDLDSSVKQDGATKEAPVKPAPPEETLVKPTPPSCGSEDINVDEIVSKQVKGDISSSTDLDRTMKKEGANTEVLVKPTPPVGQEASQGEEEISITDKTPEIKETLVKPPAPAGRSDVDETRPNQLESDISSSTILDRTVTQESANEKDLVKLSPPVEQEAVLAEGDVSLLASEPQQPEETPVTPTCTDGKTRSDAVTDAFPPEVQEGPIEPTLKKDCNVVDHECIDVSSVGTEPEEALPKLTTPIDQKKDTTKTDLDAIQTEVEEPPIQPMIKQEVEQPEKELRSAQDTESAEGFIEIEGISLVEVTGTRMCVKDVPAIGGVCL